MLLRRLAVLIVILALVGGGWWAYQTYLPRVAAFSPADGARDLPVETVFSITFSQPMQPEMVLDHLTITPRLEGEYTWQENTLTFTPAEGWPRGTTVEVSLAAGPESVLGLPLRQGTVFQFEISRTLLAYLWPAVEAADIFAIDLLNSEVRRLTEMGSVLDFVVSPDSQWIYFSAGNQETGSDLYRLDWRQPEPEMILDCEGDACQSIQISPDNSQVAFSRIGGNGVQEIWRMPLGGIARKVSASGHQTRLPQWSSLGWLVYYDVTDFTFVMIDLENGQRVLLESATGEAGTWSPSGRRFVVPELFPVTTDILRGPTGELSNQDVDEDELDPVGVLTSHLLVFDVIEETITNLSRFTNLEDAAPSLSPDGRLLAFTRKYLDEFRWTQGRQIWIMRVDGSEPRPLTDAPDYKYSNLVWHPNGRLLAAVRFNATSLIEPPELWLLDAFNGDAIKLVVSGFAPQWIP